MAGVQTFEEEFLTCGICMEIFTDPCTLSCGHSLCRKCLTSFLKTRPDGVQSGEMPCPFCRQLTPVPNASRPVVQWAGQIRPSLILQGLIDRHESEHRQVKGLDKCFLCKGVGETTPASSWCSDCEMSLCSRCAKMHLTGPLTKKHEVFDLSEGDKVKQRRKAKCKEHEGEQMKFICKDCKKAVCQTCCILKHAKHNIVSVESIVPEIKVELRKKREVLDNQKKRQMANVRKEELKIEELKSSRSRMTSQIKSDVNSVITVLRQKEKMLQNKLDDTSDRLIADHQANVKSGQITIQMYQQHCEFIDQALQSEAQVEMYDMYQVCLSGAVESLGDTESDTNITTGVWKMNYTPNIEPVKTAITEMGDIQLQNEKNPVSHHLNTLQTPVLHDTIIIKHEQDSMSFIPADITVLIINGFKTIVVADSGNNCLKSLYERGKQRQISNLKLSATSYGISKMTDNRVAATVSKCQIVIAKVRPELVLISTVKTNKQYWNVTSVSDSTLAAGTTRPSAIDILDLSGNVLRSFNSQSIGLTIQNPDYLCTTPEGNILMSDIGSNSVYCLTPEGNAVFIYKPKGERELKSPKGILTTDTGYILLADGGSKTIYLLASDGTYVRDVVTSSDGITRPSGIFVDNTNKLYVCDGSDGIKLFSFM